MADVRWPGPRHSVQRLAAERGRTVVVDACLDLLAGRDVAASVVLALGGPPARRVVDGTSAAPDSWLRVWAARGLLWLWDDRAAAAVVTALGDDSWRVREMAAKVVARHRVDEALEAVAALADDDPVPRVREASGRALRALASGGR